MSVLYSKACPGSHRSRALALWLPQCRGDLPSDIPHTTPSSRFKNRTVQYSTFIRLYWYTSREFRTRFARLMPCTIPSDSPAINFVSKRPWQTFLQTAIRREVRRASEIATSLLYPLPRLSPPCSSPYLWWAWPSRRSPALRAPTSPGTRSRSIRTLSLWQYAARIYRLGFRKGLARP